MDEGEDVSEELYRLLNIWLMDHIADDDSSYVPFVVQNIPGINAEEQAGWLRVVFSSSLVPSNSSLH
ncbi:MAG: hypothetical protein PVG12_12240 [Gammaproteobacteria bacterium]|jgi:hemerythrin